jgi:uncharacterized protein YraI
MLAQSIFSRRFKTQTYLRAALLLAALLGLLLPRPALAAEPSASVALGPLNFRAGPSLDARVLRLLDEGQALTLLGRSTDSRWLQVIAEAVWQSLEDGSAVRPAGQRLV